MGASVDRAALYRALCQLSAEQGHAVAAELEIPSGERPEASTGASHRAAVLLRWAERRPEGLVTLDGAMRGVLAASAESARRRRVWTLPSRMLRAARFSSFQRRYLRQVMAEHQLLGTPGLPSSGPQAVGLDEVYVPLRLAPSAEWPPADAAQHALLDGKEAIGELLRLTPAGQPLAIVGRAGSGKTTLLRHLALELARGVAPDGVARLPLPLDLPDHAREILESGPPLAVLAQSYRADKARFPSLHPPTGWFQQQLEGGRCLVIFDGLDELADDRARVQVARWIDREAERYGRSRFVVANSPEGYRVAPLARALVLEPLGFDGEQARRYVRAWYTASERGHGKKLPVDAEHAQRDLLQRLAVVPSVRALARSPHRLSMLVMVHRHLGTLPADAPGLYRAFCDALLEWLDGGSATAALSLPDKRRALQALAAHFMERRALELSAEKAAAVIGQALVEAHADDFDAAVLLPEFAAGSGLVRERSAGWWSYAHLGFQQYLCAAGWLERSDLPLPFEQLVGDPWWREALRLYATDGDAASVVGACLSVGGAASLALAAECVAEAPSLPGALARAVNERLDAEEESPEPARRRLAASARLDRRLRSLQHVDPRRDIDADFVTCAEYALFLEELGARGRQHRPDHWLAPGFPTGAGRSPYLGVRPEDALAFCGWLSRRSARYRLPTVEEAQSSPTSRAGSAAWCVGGSGPVRLGPGEAAEDQAIGVLAARARFGMPPPAPSVAQRLLSAEVAAGRDELARNLQWMVAACVRSVDEHGARSENLGEGATVTVREMRRTPPPECQDRAAVLAWLRIVHHTLGSDRNDLTAAHYLALRRSTYLDYHLVLDAVLAVALAHELPRLVERVALRRDAEPDTELTIALIRPLGHYGQRVRELVEARNLPAAARELSHLVTRSVPAQDVAMNRLATLVGIRLALDGGGLGAARATWSYMAQLAAYAYEFTERKSQGADSWWKGMLPADQRQRRYRDWASGPLLDIYWWAELVLARADNELPAWEGIRVTREEF